MADVLTLSTSVTFVEEDINKSTRFLDVAITHEPITHEKGKSTLPGNTVNLELASNVNFCIITLKEGKPFTIKIGDTSSQDLKNMRIFVYDGAATSIFVSNSDTDPIKIEHVTSKKA